jgi:1-acyl-sn-glycerol-3-phosphate acyltransferase
MSGSDTLVQSSQAQAASSIVAYDLALLLFRGIINIFFREVRPRGSFNIPREGPVIFVGAPHSNQVRLVALNGRRRGATSSRTP